MGKLGSRALVLLVAILSMSVIVACGDDDDDGGGSSDSGGAAKKGGSITIAQTSQPDYLDPALSYTVNGWEPQWLVYTPPITYKRAEGVEGTRADPGHRQKHARGLRGRQDRHLHHAQGPQVLRRHAREGLATSSTRIKRMLNLESGGTGFFLVIVGRAGVHRRRQARRRHLGHRDRRQDRRGHDQADRSRGRPDPQRARHELRGRSAGRHAVQEPLRRPAAGRRPLQVHEVGAQPRIRDGEERRASTFRASRRATSTRSRPRSSSPLSGQTQDVISGKLDYMQDPPPADLLPQVKAEYSDRYKSQHDGQHLLLLHEHDGAALRQAGGSPGGQLRHRLARTVAAVRRAPGPGL